MFEPNVDAKPNLDARYGGQGLPRYARWSVLDKNRQAEAPYCWLDRRTGRLVYQPDHADPNTTGVHPSATPFDAGRLLVDSNSRAV